MGGILNKARIVCQTPGKLFGEEKNNSVIIIPSALWINPVMHSDVAENCNTSDGYRLVVEQPRLFTKKPPESIHLPVCLHSASLTPYSSKKTCVKCLTHCCSVALMLPSICEVTSADGHEGGRDAALAGVWAQTLFLQV